MISSLMLPSATTLRPCCSCSIIPSSSSSSSSRRLTLFHLLTTGAIGNQLISLPFSTHNTTNPSFIIIIIHFSYHLVFWCCCCIWLFLSLLVLPPQSQFFGAKLSQANAAQNLFDWVQNDDRRFLHVVYSVADLDKTIKYIYDPS